MNNKGLLLGCLMFFIFNSAFTQDLSVHQWKNRLVLVKTDNVDSHIYHDQIKELSSNLKGIEERKIIIYQINQNTYKKGLEPTKSWKAIDAEYKKKLFKVPDSGFEVLLIGLDGGVKLKQNTLLKGETLFAKIDSMPMRQREMRRSE